ncbi:MAG: RNA-protein complex protein Nop10 [Nanoarchaeota archaeon]|nr:RNA-protein complex protein Nop10 [Nanoarchaeota archaeon]MBU1028217.1 RNA-protein complex protein Nop10 [Nanoarchaeota archaeon]
MKLKKCPSCSTYTLKDTCPKCKKQTKSAHYKFVKVKDVSQNNN